MGRSLDSSSSSINSNSLAVVVLVVAIVLVVVTVIVVVVEVAAWGGSGWGSQGHLTPAPHRAPILLLFTPSQMHHRDHITHITRITHISIWHLRPAHKHAQAHITGCIHHRSYIWPLEFDPEIIIAISDLLLFMTQPQTHLTSQNISYSAYLIFVNFGTPPQYSPNWSTWTKIGQHFVFARLKSTPLSVVMAVVTNLSYRIGIDVYSLQE